MALSFAYYVWNQEQRPSVLDIYVFEIGNRQSIFIRTPEDKRILINASGNSEVIHAISGILPFYTRRIDYLISTNASGQDVSGLIAVLNRYDISKVYVPLVTLNDLGISLKQDGIYQTFLETIQEKHIPIQRLTAGNKINFDSKVSGDVLFPVSSSTFAYSNASAPEIILKLTYENYSFLFFGNASRKVQAFVASTSFRYGAKVGNTNILFISHSALPGNMSPDLLKVLEPEYLVYSRTENSNISSNSKKSISKNKISKTDQVTQSLLNKIPDTNKLNTKNAGMAHITVQGRTLEFI